MNSYACRWVGVYVWTPYVYIYIFEIHRCAPLTLQVHLLALGPALEEGQCDVPPLGRGYGAGNVPQLRPSFPGAHRLLRCDLRACVTTSQGAAPVTTATTSRVRVVSWQGVWLDNLLPMEQHLSAAT